LIVRVFLFGLVNGCPALTGSMPKVGD